MGNNNLYDAAIIGGGPAGLTAGIYLARARYRVVIIEKSSFGGQITITDEIVNYPGVGKTSGKQLTDTMRKQAESFGCEFLLAEVNELKLDGDIKTLKTSRGDIDCFGVILATGASPRLAGFKGETEFRGKGVAYCATCDGEFFTGKDVFVIGGGFAAAEEAVFLTKYAKKVTILIRGEDFSCAEAVAEKARNHEKIEVVTNVIVNEVKGDETGLHYLSYKNKKTGEESVYETQDNFGVFVFAGYQPATSLVKDLGILDKDGYVITNMDMSTSIEGLFAVGDVRVKPLRQVATAVGDAALAATELEKYVLLMETKTGLKPTALTSKASEDKKVTTDLDSQLFSKEMVAQLSTVFSKMEKGLILELSLNNDETSYELEDYVHELAKISDKIKFARNGNDPDKPCVRILTEEGNFTGLAFHGVPGGHEFTSFVLGLYNAAGPGQNIDEKDKKDIESIDKQINMKLLVSLSCTMCPELVQACQKIASINKNVGAEVYDLALFPDLQAKYRAMSVPCLVINDGEKVSFGKKNVSEVVSLLNS